jgi:hypothetical protein
MFSDEIELRDSWKTQGEAEGEGGSNASSSSNASRDSSNLPRPHTQRQPVPVQAPVRAQTNAEAVASLRRFYARRLGPAHVKAGEAHCVQVIRDFDKHTLVRSLQDKYGAVPDGW